MQDMKYIVYVSQAKEPFSTEELKALLEHSRRRNQETGISGLLIYRFNPDYNRGNFVQVLEGAEAAIDDVWRRISSDDRHHTIIVVEEDKIETRMFGDWSMGFKNIDASELEAFDGFSDLGSDQFWENVNSDNAAAALDLLRSFYDGA
jgi:hypothetical protein